MVENTSLEKRVVKSSLKLLAVLKIITDPVGPQQQHIKKTRIPCELCLKESHKKSSSEEVVYSKPTRKVRLFF